MGTSRCAIELILAHPGKLVVTGLGKSGHVARKIVATLCSTGTPAVFLHAAEASHGDLGLYSPGDPTLMVSKSGNTFELLQLIPFLRELPSRRIGILGNPSAPLASEMDVVLDASVEREADPDNLAPTASATVALSLGHALAVALMRARNFGVEDFERFHPGGHLGRSLRLTVRDVMHGRDEIAIAHPDDSLKQVVIAMTHYPLRRGLRGGRFRPPDGAGYRRRRAPRAAGSRRYSRPASISGDDAQSLHHRAGCSLAGGAAVDGRPAVANFGAAGAGSSERRLPGPAAAARYLSIRRAHRRLAEDNGARRVRDIARSGQDCSFEPADKAEQPAG